MADETTNAPALLPVREQAVDFYGDELVAAEGPGATIYVPLRPVCKYLGLTWSGQFERLKQNPVLTAALRLAWAARGGQSLGLS